MLFSTLGRGQSITATDDGWEPQGETWDTSYESIYITHTAPEDEPPGTVLTEADFTGGALDLDSVTNVGALPPDVGGTSPHLLYATSCGSR